VGASAASAPQLIARPLCAATSGRGGSSPRRSTAAPLAAASGRPARGGPLHAATVPQPLVTQKCSPCEPADPLDFMGFCTSLDRRTAEAYMQQLDNWELREDEQGRLHLQRTWVTKNFLKGLALCEKIAEVAEGEGHHPDLHLTGWNKLTVSLWTHARNGLTENDFILAAKLDGISKEGLLRGKKKYFKDV
jgi:4a-hydroxytetrahydrobiopterin dehydratase